MKTKSFYNKKNTTVSILQHCYAKLNDNHPLNNLLHTKIVLYRKFPVKLDHSDLPTRLDTTLS